MWSDTTQRNDTIRINGDGTYYKCKKRATLYCAICVEKDGVCEWGLIALWFATFGALHPCFHASDSYPGIRFRVDAASYSQRNHHPNVYVQENIPFTLEPAFLYTQSCIHVSHD
jgi:hypothetical protein